MRTRLEVQEEIYKLRQFRALMHENADAQLIDYSIEWLEWFLGDENEEWEKSN